LWIKGEIKDVGVRILFDTGARPAIISNRLIKQLGEERNIRVMKKTLSGAGGEALSVRGSIKLPLKLLNGKNHSYDKNKNYHEYDSDYEGAVDQHEEICTVEENNSTCLSGSSMSTCPELSSISA